MNLQDINKKTIVALDEVSAPMAEEIIDRWRNDVYGFKLNHTLFPYIGKNHQHIFCDYKLFDIPNTMQKVIESVIDSGAEMISVHINNNPKAIEELAKYADKIKLLGVTYLTSWDKTDLQLIYNADLLGMYTRAVSLMNKNGFYGMVCSPADLQIINNFIPESKNLKKICPGIRSNTLHTQDQIRVSTAEDAIQNGADYLVMGRSFFAKT